MYTSVCNSAVAWKLPVIIDSTMLNGVTQYNTPDTGCPPTNVPNQVIPLSLSKLPHNCKFANNALTNITVHVRLGVQFLYRFRVFRTEWGV